MAGESVTFPTTVGGTGETFTNDSNAATGLGNGGYLTRFWAILGNIVAIAAFIVTKATQVASDALAAQNAAFTPATSISPVTLAASGAVTFATQSGKTFPAGYKVRAASNANPDTHWMIFAVTNYAGTSLQGTATAKGSGTGSRSDWTFSPAGEGSGDVSSTRAINTSGLATGGGNLTADRTIDVPKAAAAEVRALTNDTKALTAKSLADAAAFVTLTDAATVNTDCSLGENFVVTLGGNRLMANPTNMKDGVVYSWKLVEDATGGRMPSWDTIWDWGEIGPPTLSTAAGKADRVFGQFDATANKLIAQFRKAA